MPKLKPDTQRARREHILDAAEQCFGRAGFHRTSMHDICREAGVSPGALYVYFDSKEALIAGIAERDRADFAERFDQLAAAPDFLQALKSLGEQYFLEQPAHKKRMCIEIGLESTRNPQVGEIQQRIDRYIADSFEKLFRKLAAEGRIAPALDIPTTVKAFMVVADGMFWHHAVDPAFDPAAVMPAVLQLIRTLLNPVEPVGSGDKSTEASPRGRS
ncbi:MAG TPA: TetR/AcrR family transcriptional regulator [Hyphomicrobiaceae bacterium]|nr:TetR/AcrR family transcriptional regulator [Hyphomicrobiaceae bacterium]